MTRDCTGNNVGYWLDRAEEVRAQAEQMRYREPRLVMLEIAEGYARMAARAAHKSQEESARIKQDGSSS